MLSTVLSDTRMCRKRGFGWALWSVKTDCTVYTIRESPPLLFSPITLQVTSHSSPILPSIVSLSMNTSSKFKGLQTNSPWHLSGGNLSTLEIQKVQWELNLSEREEGCTVENFAISGVARIWSAWHRCTSPTMPSLSLNAAASSRRVFIKATTYRVFFHWSSPKSTKSC